MDLGSGQFGRDNPTYGFVYPQSAQTQLVATVNTGGFDPDVAAGRTSYDPSRQAGLFHFAIADADPYRGGRGRRNARSRTARYSIRLATAWRGHAHIARRSGSAAAHSRHAAARQANARTTEIDRQQNPYRTALAD